MTHFIPHGAPKGNGQLVGVGSPSCSTLAWVPAIPVTRREDHGSMKAKPEGSLSLVHLIRPPTVPPAGPAPLLMLLHGIGSHERDLMELAPELDGRFFIVSARAPVTLGSGSYALSLIHISEP